MRSEGPAAREIMAYPAALEAPVTSRPPPAGPEFPAAAAVEVAVAAVAAWTMRLPVAPAAVAAGARQATAILDPMGPLAETGQATPVVAVAEAALRMLMTMSLARALAAL